MRTRRSVVPLALLLAVAGCNPTSSGGAITSADAAMDVATADITTATDDGVAGPAMVRFVFTRPNTDPREVMVTQVSCSFDVSRNAVRSFQGRVCIEDECSALSIEPAPADAGLALYLRAPGGGGYSFTIIRMTTSLDRTSSPPTATIDIESEIGPVTITGCPAS